MKHDPAPDYCPWCGTANIYPETSAQLGQFFHWCFRCNSCRRLIKVYVVAHDVEVKQ